MAVVIVENNDVEAALRKLNKKVEHEQIMKELKKRRFYKSKGCKRREAIRKAEKKAARKARRKGDKKQ